MQGVFSLGRSTEKLILARLVVSRTIFVNVDLSNLGSPYFIFFGEAQCKKHPVCVTFLARTIINVEFCHSNII